MTWHTQSVDDVMTEVQAGSTGLSSTAAATRRQTSGLNQLAERKSHGAWTLFLHQFKDFMILVLVAAAIVSGIAGELTDTLVILFIVLLNGVVGFFQENKGEKAMAALKKLSTLKAAVLRDGEVKQLDARYLVPGDIVLLEAGNAVPADLRLTEVQGLQVGEASLTGESAPVSKTTHTLQGNRLPLGDRRNMAYKTTQVTAGSARGVVVAIGMQTEIGKIADMLQQKPASTPLQQRMADFGKKLSYLILIVCLLLFGVGLLRGQEPVQMLLLALSLAVAAIPEALPALITLALSLGAARLVKRQVLVRKLAAVETLGSVSYICTDKTGTLTQNHMHVTDVVAAKPEKFDDRISLLEAFIALNNSVHLSEGVLVGDPTETAMVAAVAKEHGHFNLAGFQKELPQAASLPFDSDRKCMTTVHRWHNHFLVVTKGAAEAIASRVNDSKEAQRILEDAGRLATQGKRVLAFAYKVVDHLPATEGMAHLEEDLHYAGQVAMIDPPRPEIKASIAECRSAGIRPVMITGDHRQTAVAIASQIGLMEEGDASITGDELEQVSDEAFKKQVNDITVYARVSPAQKLRIVTALQANGHFVAMTGDGVNDAPSLRSANIGVAMGITGTDVSKEAAHMILLDDNFSSIVKAVREGRRIYDNIRRFVKYIMSCNGAEILTIFLAPLFGLPLPLLPIHILWINLVTDGLPGLALAAERAEHNVMKRPPRQPGESLISGSIGWHVAWVGMLMAALTLTTQAFAINAGYDNWQTMVFVVLSFSQLGHVLAIRSETEFIYKKGIYSNPFLFFVIIATVGLQLLVVYLPAANAIFKTAPLTLEQLLICLLVSAFNFHVVEFEKWIMMKRRRVPA